MASGGKRRRKAAPRARRIPLAGDASPVARLRRERDLARGEAAAAQERQKATDEILDIIARSPSDVQPVFNAIARHAVRLCKGKFGLVFRYDGKLSHFVAHHGFTPKSLAILRSRYPRTPQGLFAHAMRRQVALNIPDVFKDRRAVGRAVARAQGYRSFACVPMLRDGKPIGTISVQRREAGRFADHQVGALQTFAAQAAIAIENARLFNETKEALEQQRASAEVLGAISGSMSNTQPVFDRILESCERLFAGRLVGINVLGADGRLHLGAYRGEGRERFEKIFPLPADEGSGSGLAMLRGQVVHYANVDGDASVPPPTRAGCAALGVKSVIFAPMMAEEGAIGAIFVGRRHAVPFSDKEIELLKGFANQAAISIKNVRLFNETKEALERQTATSEVLRVISQSQTDTQPVFDAIIRSAVALCAGTYGSMVRVEGDTMHLWAHYNYTPEALELVTTRYPAPVSENSLVGLAVRTAAVVHSSDRLNDSRSRETPYTRSLGIRAQLTVPLLRDGQAIGTLNVLRKDPGPFADEQIALLRTFADQAVIAIENVRLFNETKESLERQTATGEILNVIAGSPANVQPVFDAIVQSAARLFDRKAALRLVEPDGLRRRAWSYAMGDEFHGAELIPMERSSLVGSVALECKALQFADAQGPDSFPYSRAHADQLSYRAAACAPLVRDGAAIGVITVTSPNPGLLSDKQLALLKTFADQAVIAIENVRLFNETREALERQTATAEILRVISGSPADVQPVLEAVAASAARLCEATDTVIQLREGDELRNVAHVGEIPMQQTGRFPLARGWLSSRSVMDGRQIHVHDLAAETEEYPLGSENARKRGFHTALATPLKREGTAIGAILIRRAEMRPFADNQLELVQTFADQAVIAIENVRLFNETKESLERQTATAEILKVIASSPSDVQPVFDAIVQSASRLFGRKAALRTVESGSLQRRAKSFADTEFQGPDLLSISRDSIVGRAVLDGKASQFADTQDAGATPFARANAGQLAFRAMAAAPLMRESKAIGVISVSSDRPGALSEKQMALLATFADQAVIAIENVRLFNETREALEQQTATAEILQVISGSPTNTQPVFDAIVQSGLRLFPNATVAVALPEGNKVRAAAVATQSPELLEAWRARFPFPLAREYMHGAAILDGVMIDVPDAEAEVSGPLGPGIRNFLASGYRAITIMPMICDDTAIGAISVIRQAPGPLSEKQIALLRTFAAQAVIAIENVRVFKELEARTGALTRSVEQLTALGEVGQAISSTLDLDTVLRSIVSRAVQLTGLDGGTIYEYDERSEEFNLRAAENLSDGLVAMLRDTPMRKGEGVIGHAVETGEPIEIADMRDESYQSPRRDSLLQAGYRALLVVPLRREDHIIGALAVNRKAPGHFSHEVVGLLKTFATQSAMAIQNARLFREIAQKGRELEEASQHKSQFLASMSHELRTPLNAILGFNEMILGQVYGDVPADMQEPLKDIQTSGRHLLRLINNVLDLAKIEAGRMELSLQDYSVHDTVESVRATLRPLAAEKGLEFLAHVPQDLPLAHGDSGRITQCLMNLAGNALKFTRAGKVEISAAARGDWLVYKVTDTGVGIPPDKIGSLFTEFKQTDSTIASEYGGTGLGLSISRKFVEMHGGRIWVESEPGKGSAFIFEVPLRVKTA